LGQGPDFILYKLFGVCVKLVGRRVGKCSIVYPAKNSPIPAQRELVKKQEKAAHGNRNIISSRYYVENRRPCRSLSGVFPKGKEKHEP
jgi:hypothetical protein